ncbi:hypothetical protein IBL26_19630, partial [Roseomonas aerophila]|nr:hypothetical protein [Pseudoroseomonas aerophila]
TDAATQQRPPRRDGRPNRGPRDGNRDGNRAPRPQEGQPAEARDATPRPPREGRPEFRQGDRPRGPRDGNRDDRNRGTRDDRPRGGNRDRDQRGGGNEGRTYSFDAPKPAKADPDSPFAVLAKLKLGKG